MAIKLIIFLNSLATGKFEWNFRYSIFQIISVIDGWSISCELVLIWMSLALTDDKSTLVQVMAWCHQATSHYLSQCWPRSLSPYGVTRLQCVNYAWIPTVAGCLWHTPKHKRIKFNRFLSFSITGNKMGFPFPNWPNISGLYHVM